LISIILSYEVWRVYMKELYAIQLSTRLMPLLLVACVAVEGQTQPAHHPQKRSVQDQVAAIRKKVMEIEALAKRSATGSGLRYIDKQLPHWQLSCALKADVPVFADALFTQGRFVRHETYYFDAGQLISVTMESWWDADGVLRENNTRHGYYLHHGRIIRRIVRSRGYDVSVSAATLVERSEMIVRALSSDGKQSMALRSLEVFPIDERRHGN
jgi:hypothetical protein